MMAFEGGCESFEWTDFVSVRIVGLMSYSKLSNSSLERFLLLILLTRSSRLQADVPVGLDLFGNLYSRF